MKCIVKYLIIVTILIKIFNLQLFAQDNNDYGNITKYDYNNITSNEFNYTDHLSYTEYLSKHKDAKDSVEDIKGIPENPETVFEGKESVLCENLGEVKFIIDIPFDGLFNIGIEYKQVKQINNEMNLSLLIDGTIPYDEANNIKLEKYWKDANEIFSQDDYSYI